MASTTDDNHTQKLAITGNWVKQNWLDVSHSTKIVIPQTFITTFYTRIPGGSALRRNNFIIISSKGEKKIAMQMHFNLGMARSHDKPSKVHCRRVFITYLCRSMPTPVCVGCWVLKTWGWLGWACIWEGCCFGDVEKLTPVTGKMYTVKCEQKKKENIPPLMMFTWGGGAKFLSSIHSGKC